jgi:hypothetical protein
MHGTARTARTASGTARATWATGTRTVTRTTARPGRTWAAVKDGASALQAAGTTRAAARTTSRPGLRAGVGRLGIRRSGGRCRRPRSRWRRRVHRTRSGLGHDDATRRRRLDAAYFCRFGSDRGSGLNRSRWCFHRRRSWRSDWSRDSGNTSGVTSGPRCGFYWRRRRCCDHDGRLGHNRSCRRTRRNRRGRGCNHNIWPLAWLGHNPAWRRRWCGRCEPLRQRNTRGRRLSRSGHYRRRSRHGRSRRRCYSSSTLRRSCYRGRRGSACRSCCDHWTLWWRCADRRRRWSRGDRPARLLLVTLCLFFAFLNCA